MTIGVALVDGVPLFRDGLSGTVNRALGLRWLGALPAGQAARTFVELAAPDVVLIDALADPRCALTRTLTTLAPKLAVISLVREPFRTRQFLADVTAAGAHGVLRKSVEPAQLVEAIQRVHVERRYLDPELNVISHGIGNTARGGGRLLSRREEQVLRLVADGLQNQEIAGILFLGTETVRTHVKSILRKLDARERAHAVALAFRLGVLDLPARDSLRKAS